MNDDPIIEDIKWIVETKLKEKSQIPFLRSSVKGPEISAPEARPTNEVRNNTFELSLDSMFEVDTISPSHTKTTQKNLDSTARQN